MMNDITPFTIYWITRLDGIIIALFVFSLILFAVAIVVGITYEAMKYDSLLDAQLARDLKRIFYGCCIACTICTLGIVLTPSTKTAAAMYVVPKIVHNEKIQATANSLYDLAVKWLRETHNKE